METSGSDNSLFSTEAGNSNKKVTNNLQEKLMDKMNFQNSRLHQIEETSTEEAKIKEEEGA